MSGSFINVIKTTQTLQPIVQRLTVTTGPLLAASNVLALQATSASYAVTASYAANAGSGGSGGNFVPLSGSSTITGSLTLNSGSFQLNEDMTLGYSGSVKRKVLLWSDASNNGDANYGYGTIEVRKQDGTPSGGSDNRGNEMVFTNRSYLASNSSGFKFIHSGSNLGGYNLFELIGNGTQRFAVNNTGDVSFTGQIGSDIYTNHSNTALRIVSTFGTTTSGPALSFMNSNSHGIGFTWGDNGTVLMALRGTDTTNGGAGQLIIGAASGSQTGSLWVVGGSNQSFFSAMRDTNGAVLLESYNLDPATAGVQLKNSPTMVFRGSYWNGSPNTLDCASIQGQVISQNIGKLVLASQGHGWSIQGDNGNLFAETDNSQDIGASASNRPRNLYLGTQVTAPLVSTTEVFSNSSLACQSANGFDIAFAIGAATITRFGAGGNISVGYGCAQTNHVLHVAGNTWISGALNIYGNVSMSADNAYDIGTASSGRPRNLYIAGDYFGTAFHANSSITLGGSQVIIGGGTFPSIQFNSRTAIHENASDTLSLGEGYAKTTLTGSVTLTGTMTVSLPISASSGVNANGIYTNASNGAVIFEIIRADQGAKPFQMDITGSQHRSCFIGTSVSGSGLSAEHGLQVLGADLIVASGSVPTSTADAQGTVGAIRWANGFIFVKTTTGWQRAALSTF